MTTAILGYAAAHRDDPRHGLYHLTAAGAVSWFGFAQAIFAEAETALSLPPPRLVPITTAEYPLPAQRPANSRLDTALLSKTFGIKPATWQNMLQQCMQEKRPG